METLSSPATLQKRFLKVEEVADYLGISEDTVYTMVSQRQIPYTKVGRLLRFDRKAIEAWLEKNSVKVRRPEAPY